MKSREPLNNSIKSRVAHALRWSQGSRRRS